MVIDKNELKRILILAESILFESDEESHALIETIRAAIAEESAEFPLNIRNPLLLILTKTQSLLFDRLRKLQLRQFDLAQTEFYTAVDENHLPTLDRVNFRHISKLIRANNKEMKKTFSQIGELSKAIRVFFYIMNRTQNP